MSIILKGIDLPNSGQIEIIIRPHGEVFSNTRGIYAEAIQIPKGHGRLIDEDALIDDLIEQKVPFNARVNESIITTPTILEAEE